MLNFHKDHKSLVLTASAVFIFLSMVIAVGPAYQMQNSVAPLPSQHALSPQEERGLKVYVSENCMACHTQQVRNIEMDKQWGSRPSIPSDYYYSKQRMDLWRQSPSLLGSERTGPDLTNAGQRQPGKEWHLLHLYNPRIVVKASVMPAYAWLFEEKDSSLITSEDVIVPVPVAYLKNKKHKVVAKQEALDLVSYLQGLKQAPLPVPESVNFISGAKKKEEVKTAGASTVLDGENLYTQTCAACHQANGKGLPGAFPSLAGSSIVNDKDPERLVKIILQGYDAREEFGQMPGFASQLTDEEIAAIASHERSSWGNNAPEVTVDEVKRIRENSEKLNP